MLKVNAKAFYKAALHIQRALSSLEAQAGRPGYSPYGSPNADFQESLAKDFSKRIRKPLAELGVPVTLVALDNLIKWLSAKKVTHGTLLETMKQIEGRFGDELSLIKLLALTEPTARYFASSEPLFGQDVFDKFGDATDDIEGAGNCLALGQGTACVLHLMRVMEVGLKALAKLLAIPYAPSWESYIAQITTRIGAKHKTKGVKWKRDEPFFRDLNGDLIAIKQSWRNPTMHVGRKYQPDEAEEIFRAVKRFMNRLVERI